MTGLPDFESENAEGSASQTDSRQYAGFDAAGLEASLAEILLRRYPDLPKMVHRAYRRWNLTIREILRAETGLRLGVGEQRQVVPVRVVAGLPASFRRVFSAAPDSAQWGLALHQELLVGTQSGLNYLQNSLDDLVGLAGEARSPNEELDTIAALVDKLVAKARSFNLLHAILSIDEDVLGTYSYSTYDPGVSLYWLPIGIVATMLGVSIEALTIVVLAHELAHAYTHLGLDIDGQAWQVNSFHRCDRHIVEGLAQFYARTVSHKIAADFPAALDAFEKLLREQPPAYTSFQAWITEVEAPGELIRYCLIRTRTQNLSDYFAFLDEVEQGKDSLRQPK